MREKRSPKPGPRQGRGPQGRGPARPSVLNTVVASVCILIYVAAIAAALVMIYFNFGDYRLQAREEFYDLVDRAVTTSDMGFMSQPYQEIIQEAVRESQTLEGVIISGFEDNRFVSHPFEKTPGHSIGWEEGYVFKKSFDLSTEVFEQPLPVEGLGELTISAIYNRINYPFVVNTLKYTLFIIAAAAGTAFLTLFLGTVLGKNRSRADTEDGGEPFTEETRAAGMPEEEPLPEEEWFTTPFTEEPPAGPGSGELFEEEAPANPERRPAPERPRPPAGAPAPDPAGRRAPGGGQKRPAAVPPARNAPESPISAEAQTRDRLILELQRAASSNRDLTFIALETRGDNWGEDFYGRLAAEAARFFGSRDLVFEREKRGFSVIIPRMDLDGGLAKTREFRNRLLEDFAGSPLDETGLYAGLSSRSERPVDADRLMFEARSALERAVRDPDSPLIAFRSDPEKYRAFINSQKEEVIKAVRQNRRRP